MKNIFHGTFKVTQPYTAGHGGLDIVGIDSHDIISPVSGTVKSSTIIPKSSGNITWEWGNYVRVDDASGNRYFFCHMDSRAVKVGDTIKVGDKLGIMGNTGLSFGTHCHFETRSKGNIRTNPAVFLGIPNRCGTYTPDEQPMKWVKTAKGWTYGGVKNAWKKIDGRWYWFDRDGIAVTGLQLINGRTYAFADRAFQGIVKECQLIMTDQNGAII